MKILEPSERGNHMTRVTYANHLRSKLPKEVNLIELTEQLNIENVDDHRYYSCIYYDKCVVIAAYLAWASFSCKRCPIWKG